MLRLGTVCDAASFMESDVWPQAKLSRVVSLALGGVYDFGLTVDESVDGVSFLR